MATVIDPATELLIKQLRDQLSAAGDQAKKLESARQDLANQLQRAQEQIKQLMTERPQIAVTNIATTFRDLIEGSQPDPTKHTGDVAAALQGLDIELKGFIQIVDGQTQIIPPKPGDPVDPNSLSTLHLSFGSVPVLRQTATSTQPPTAATTNAGHRRAVQSEPTPPPKSARAPAAKTKTKAAATKKRKKSTR